MDEQPWNGKSDLLAACTKVIGGGGGAGVHLGTDLAKSWRQNQTALKYQRHPHLHHRPQRILRNQNYCYFQPTLKHTSKKIKFPKLLKWKNLSLKVHVCCSSINHSSMSTQLLVLQLLLSSSLLKISIVPPGITNSSAFLFSSVQYIGFSAHHIAATVTNLLRPSLSSFSNSSFIFHRIIWLVWRKSKYFF